MWTKFRKLLAEYGLEYFNKYYGTYRGFVEDNEDVDEFCGRLKIRVPQIHGDEVPDYWAPGKGQFAGNQVGSFAIPKIGEVVWVTFENGDPNYPIWEHGYWGRGEVPAEAKNNGNKPTNFVFKTYSGNVIEIDDKAGDELIRITDKTGNIHEMNKHGVSTKAAHIFLGQIDTANEPALLGDTTKQKIEDIIDQIDALADSAKNISNGCSLITVPTALGPSGPPVNSATFISESLVIVTSIKVHLATIKAGLSAMLSNKVKLD